MTVGVYVNMSKEDPACIQGCFSMSSLTSGWGCSIACIISGVHIEGSVRALMSAAAHLKIRNKMQNKFETSLQTLVLCLGQSRQGRGNRAAKLNRNKHTKTIT